MALKLGVRAGRAWLMATHPGLEPCWGKLDARHLRGGAGNVAMRAGLRPTAKAVATPPDATAGAPALYPTASDSPGEDPWATGGFSTPDDRRADGPPLYRTAVGTLRRSDPAQKDVIVRRTDDGRDDE